MSFPCERGQMVFTCKPDSAGFTNHTCGQDEVLLELRPGGTEHFKVYDSGERKVFDSGMQRDTTTGKIDYTLVFDGPMFERLAEHLDKGARKYDKRNWMKASGPEELDRFKESALRHFMQWLRGDVDEDHAAAVFFNINGAEYVKEKLKGENNERTRSHRAQAHS